MAHQKLLVTALTQAGDWEKEHISLQSEMPQSFGFFFYRFFTCCVAESRIWSGN